MAKLYRHEGLITLRHHDGTSCEGNERTSLDLSYAQQNGSWHRDVMPWWIFVFVSSSSPASGSRVWAAASRPGSWLAVPPGNGRGRRPPSQTL